MIKVPTQPTLWLGSSIELSRIKVYDRDLIEIYWHMKFTKPFRGFLLGLVMGTVLGYSLHDIIYLIRILSDQFSKGEYFT